MHHTIPLVVMGMQLGTAIVSLHLTMEDVNNITNAGKPRSLNSYDPTAMSQFIIDVISDVVAFVCGVSNHLSLLCLFSIMSVLFTATALNVVGLFAALIRLIIVTLRRYHWVVRDESLNAATSTKIPSALRHSYPLMKPNTMRFILSLFTNGVLFFTSLYLVIVILCLIRRKTGHLSQAVVLLYNPLQGEVTWQPKKYARLIPVFGTLLSLSGCACLMGFVIGVTILMEDRGSQQQQQLNHWNGLQCGVISLLAGIFTILSVICADSKGKLLSYFSVLFTLVALISSTLTLHSEQFLFPQLEERLVTVGSGNSPHAPNLDLDATSYRHILLTKIALVTFASVFNYIFAVPLLSLLVLHVANQRSIHLVPCSIASQPPSYRDYSHSELIPLESSLPLMEMTDSQLFAAREHARYLSGSSDNTQNQMLAMNMRANMGPGMYAVPNAFPMGFQNRVVSPDSVSSSLSTRRQQHATQRQQSPLTASYSMTTAAPSGRCLPLDSMSGVVDENDVVDGGRYTGVMQDQLQQQQSILFYNPTPYNVAQQSLALSYSDTPNAGVRRESLEKLPPLLGHGHFLTAGTARAQQSAQHQAQYQPPPIEEGSSPVSEKHRSESNIQ